MAKKPKIFTPEELARIEDAVSNAEKKTSGEIVTLIVAASNHYHWIPWMWAVVGWAVASVILEIIALRSPWSIPVDHLLEVQVLGSLVGYVIGLLRPIKRLSLNKKHTREIVHRQCLANFLATGITETRDRTGILIYISEFERIVHVLADRGIHKMASDSYWNDQVNLVVKGLKTGRGCDALCEAIGQIGDKLAEHFPPRPDDTNELSNAPQVGEVPIDF